MKLASNHKTLKFDLMTESETPAQWLRNLQPGCSIAVSRNKEGVWTVTTFDGEYKNTGKGKTLQAAFEDEQ